MIKYGLTTYRTRLEATWAAYFQKLGWQYVYEPFGLEFGSDFHPEFLIHAERPLFVSVAYHAHCLADVCAAASKMTESEHRDVLVVGTCPFTFWAESGYPQVALGSFAGYGDRAVLTRKDRYDVASHEQSFRHRISGFYDGASHELDTSQVHHALTSWEEVHDRVRRLNEG